MAAASRMAFGSGEATTRRKPRPASSRTTQSRSAASLPATSSARNGPMGLVGFRKAGSEDLTSTWVTISTTPSVPVEAWWGASGTDGRVPPPVGPVGAEVQGVATAQRVFLPLDLEAHRAVQQEDQLFAGVFHRLGPGVSPRLHGGNGPGHEEVAVGAADAGQFEAVLGGEDLLALVGANEDRGLGLLLVD